MTDGERDQIDQDAQIFMRTCSEAIKQLRGEGLSLCVELTEGSEDWIFMQIQDIHGFSDFWSRDGAMYQYQCWSDIKQYSDCF